MIVATEDTLWDKTTPQSILSLNKRRNIMEEKEAIKASKVSIIINLVLSAFKLIAGIIASSYAMISDSFSIRCSKFSYSNSRSKNCK